MRTAKLSLAFLVCSIVLAATAVAASAAVGEFGMRDAKVEFRDPDKVPVTQAGGHPDVLTHIKYNLEERPGGAIAPAESVRDIVVDLPAGFYGNPQSFPQCNMDQLIATEGYCDIDAQVGVFYLDLSVPFGGETFYWEFPIYNMVSSDSQTAVLSAVVLSVPVKMIVSVRTDGDYGLTFRTPQINDGISLSDPKLDIWGVPTDPRHDVQRCVFFFDCGYPSGLDVERPYLTLPTRCGEALVTDVRTRSWEHPERWVEESLQSPALTGCESVDFSPSLEARPTTNVVDSPSGLDVDVHIPQNTDPNGLSSAHLRNAEVKFPPGLVLNPSGANGLGSCDPGQIHLTTPIGKVPPFFAKAEPECPDPSRIGTVRVDTPLLADPMFGSVYLATPYKNPYGSMVAIYATFKGPGLNVKVPGEVLPDPKTGQLVARFAENPQLSFDDFKMNFFGGAFAPFRTPTSCGTYTTSSVMTPWSAPESGPPDTPSDTYTINHARGGRPCSGALPNEPDFEAGSMAALAGQFRPFVMNLRRNDATQEFSSITLSPPPGLVAKLKGTAPCSEAELAAAAGKEGRAEQTSPSCPAASQIGNVYTAAGAGPAPYNAPGKVYLAGPYKGAPLSLAVVVPAVAGPFDLGTIVNRSALFIDPVTAKITAKSDPLPTILKGIPLDIRTISIRLDKPDFVLNPSSCDPSEVTGSLATTSGSVTPLQIRFQLAECGRLRFKPRLSLSLSGSTRHGGFPALKAVLRPRPDDANVERIRVAFPRSEFLEQGHIGTVCTRVQWAANACPAASVYGTVSVTTPLLDYPLNGNVYLRSSNNKLPDLVPDLRGPAWQPIRFEAAGKTDSVNGGIRNTFTFIPDVPFTKLTLKLAGGKKGLLVNSRDICRSKSRAEVGFRAHNGLKAHLKPVIKAACGKGGKR
jgi:hypothetical protein